VVAPRDTTIVELQAAQAMVNAIWTDMELRYPPAVQRLPRHATATLASADRLSIRLSSRTPSWCLLHEIAHAMTTTQDGRSDAHGALFLGMYVRLLVRYLRLDEADLLASLAADGIAVVPDARPVFVDS
jgi:hypothetical protein